MTNRNDNFRDIHKEHFVTKMGMAPFRGFSRGYTHVSSNSGAVRFIKPILLSYLALLSIESMYISMPVLSQKLGGQAEIVDAKELRFLPKPFVDDGASLGRLSPLPNVSRLLNDINPLPEFLKPNPSTTKTVWNNWGVFLLAVGAAVTIQQIESWAIRSKSVKESRDDFDKYNSIKKVHADANAVAVARLKAKQMNHYGSGDVAAKGSLMAGLYLAEILAFTNSFVPGSGLGIKVLYGFLTVFGYEMVEKIWNEED